jgi:hypothetical protein
MERLLRKLNDPKTLNSSFIDVLTPEKLIYLLVPNYQVWVLSEPKKLKEKTMLT